MTRSVGLRHYQERSYLLIVQRRAESWWAPLPGFSPGPPLPSLPLFPPPPPISHIGNLMPAPPIIISLFSLFAAASVLVVYCYNEPKL